MKSITLKTPIVRPNQRRRVNTIARAQKDNTGINWKYAEAVNGRAAARALVRSSAPCRRPCAEHRRAKERHPGPSAERVRSRLF